MGMFDNLGAVAGVAGAPVMLAGTALSMGSGLTDMYGASKQNQANWDMMEATNSLNQTNAREQMAFQERMSSTAHTREIADLKNAGLNPILSANAGSSAPSGASGSASNTPQANIMGGLSASAKELFANAMAVRRQEADLKLIDAQTKKTNVDAAVATKGIPEADLKNRAYKVLSPWIDKLEEASKSVSPKPTPKSNSGKDIGDYDMNIPNPWKKQR